MLRYQLIISINFNFFIAEDVRRLTVELQDFNYNRIKQTKMDVSPFKSKSYA